MRDIQLSRQVWEHKIGYPGDSAYLDFHKKHLGGWHRYWRITDARADLQYKQDYYPEEAFNRKVPDHAGHYKWLIKESLKSNFYNVRDARLACMAFDAELFGHWWFEGLQWLYYVLKWITMDPEITLKTSSEYIYHKPSYNYISMPESSWGNNFDSSTWMNPDVYWVWERIYNAEKEIQLLAQHFWWKRGDEILMRIIKQAIRELFFLQSSDWEFMITNWSTRDHAEARVGQHYDDFRRLCAMAWNYGYGRWVKQSDWDFLSKQEWLRGIFDPELEWFR